VSADAGHSLARRSRGVYFLANDGMFEFAIAFLNSFRTHNPDIALCLIPYDSAVERLIGLEREYAFCVWSDLAALESCDEISMRFHGTALGQYRKLAAWEGNYEDFVYIDTDTVVLESIGFAFDLLRSFAFLLLESNVAKARKWVWRDSISQTGRLTEEQIAFAANTGFIASRKGALTLSGVRSKLPGALQLAPHMELLCTEQPLLNYLITTSGEKYTSNILLRRRHGRWKLPIQRWAGNAIGTVREGRIVEPLYPRVVLVHWAGEWRKLAGGCLPHYDLWRYYRELRTGITSAQSV